MSFSNLTRDKYGRWTRKTNWIVVCIVVACIGTLIAFFIHAHGKTVKSNLPSADVVLTSGSVIAGNCQKVSEHSWNCSDRSSLAKWNAYLETRSFTATVTAYTSRVQETDKSPEIAANGQNIWNLYQAHENTCATNDYKIGTKLTILGLGDCTVRDRMNSRYNGKNHVDWYYGYATSDALAFGVRKMKVTIN